MPTVLRLGPYRFFFYAGDRHEPPHVHVERDADKAKFWLEPVRHENSVGFRTAELNKLFTLIAERREDLLNAWHEYFGH